MRFYMTTPKDSAKDYTMEEMYRLNEWQNKIIHPLDDEAKYWQQWINDPLTIKKYYDEDPPKCFEDREKYPDVYYDLDTLSEEQLDNLETYNHVNVDLYNELVKQKKYDLALTTLDEQMFPKARGVRDMIMCGAPEKDIINSLCRAFGKSYTIDIYSKFISKNQALIEGASTSKEDPLINKLTKEEIDNIQAVMDKYVVDVMLGRLRAESFDDEKEDKQFVDLKSYGYKIDNYLMYIPDVKEQKIFEKHEFSRKKIAHLLLTKDKSKHTVGTVVDNKHIGKLPVVCVDGEKRQDLRWNRYFGLIDKDDQLTYVKVVYSLQVKDLPPYVPVLVIVTCFTIDVKEILKDSPQLKRSIDDTKYILLAPIDEVYGQNDLNYLSRMIDEMTYGTVNDVIRRLEGMKFYYFDDPNKIIDLSESEAMSLSYEQLKEIDSYDEDTHEWKAQRCNRLHPAQFVEKYYDADDTSVKDADYLNWYYHNRYCFEELTEEKLQRLRKYNHKNADIHNMLYTMKARQYSDVDNIIPDSVIDDDWRDIWFDAYESIVYGHPQEEIHSKLQAAFGKDVTDEVWYQYYPKED
nr:MAG TPA: hypothetical protein [Caudoviricetes sp.]